MGEPDGATEDLGAYISVGKKIDFDFSKLDTCVLIGRKGSGKSLCMRKFQDASEHSPDRFCIRFTNKNPALPQLIHFSVSIPDNERTATWQSIWEFSILLSTATMLVHRDEHEERFSQNVKKSYIDNFARDFHELFLGLDDVTHPYDVLDVLLAQYDDYQELMHFLSGSLVKNFKNRIRRILRSTSTFCFFLDALDEELRRAPSLLIDITRGLFYCVMHMKRDTSFSNKIHVTIAIRDIVFSSIRQSEHYDRYVDTSYISSLPWNAALLSEFTQRKIGSTVRRLGNDGGVWASRKADSLASLLGFQRIYNDAKKCDEDVLIYFIRHTNYVPRHLIRLGNKIFEEIDNSEEGAIGPDRFKEIVNELSKEIAEQLVNVSSAYLVSFAQGAEIGHLLRAQEDYNALVGGATPFRQEAIEPYMEEAAKTLTRGFVKPILNFIRHIGKDVFSATELNGALANFTDENVGYGGQIDNHELNRLENILWSQGLLGTRHTAAGKESDRFYFFSGIGSFSVLPACADKYVFFPGLVDLCNLRVEPGMPIGGNS